MVKYIGSKRVLMPVIEELARRYTTALGGAGGATLTFDAGQNSEPNFTRLADPQIDEALETLHALADALDSPPAVSSSRWSLETRTPN